MRDPNRIKLFLKELEKYWTKYPDTRFGQLIYNFNKRIREDGDTFNIENNEYLECIKKAYKEDNFSNIYKTGEEFAKLLDIKDCKDVCKILKNIEARERK